MLTVDISFSRLQENILFETDDEEESNLVLVDMGFATVCEPGTTLGQVRVMPLRCTCS
jgi:hypothetical protein